jgi:hypothetical protein
VGTPSSSLRGQKRELAPPQEPARDNISSIPLSEEHYWSPRRKNSKTQLQEHKELTS